MKLLTAAVALVAALALAGTVSQVNKQKVVMQTTDSLTESIRKQLLTIEAAGVDEVSCQLFYGKNVIKGTHCFLSRLRPEELLPLIQEAMKPLGSTPGWSNDYSVWGAFYQSGKNSELTFGVNIGSVDGNPDFEGKRFAQGYLSFITMGAESKS